MEQGTFAREEAGRFAYLDWPFFGERHRSLARDAARWARDARRQHRVHPQPDPLRPHHRLESAGAHRCLPRHRGAADPGLAGLTPGLTDPGLGTGFPGEIPIAAPIGLDPMAGTYPILGDPTIGLPAAPAASSGGIISDLTSAANQLGVGQAVDLVLGKVGS